MTNQLKVKRLNHLAVMCGDLERSFRFYHDLLGLEKVQYVEHHDVGISEMVAMPNVHMKEYRMRVPTNPDIIFDLIQWVSPTSPEQRCPIHQVPSAHVAFDVEDLEATYQHLKSQGVEFVSPPVHWPEEEGGWVVLFLYDPDGNLLELIESKG
jgi:catechol 2,3-dioxygenase-like lactoylglutathione lyase family enzyme